jgi:hypothetical protein
MPKNGIFYADCPGYYNNCRMLSCFKNGFNYTNSPTVYWVSAVLVIVTLMKITGLGILLHTKIRVYFEIRKS